MSEPEFCPSSPEELWDEVPGKEREERRAPGLYINNEQFDPDEGIRNASYLAFDEAGLVAGLYLFQQAPAAPEQSIVVRPDARRRGWGSKLYALAAERGWDIEAGSGAALQRGEMTAEGYAFMRSRARRQGQGG